MNDGSKRESTRLPNSVSYHTIISKICSQATKKRRAVAALNFYLVWRQGGTKKGPWTVDRGRGLVNEKKCNHVPGLLSWDYQFGSESTYHPSVKGGGVVIIE
jgi:hypothetical protein